MKLLLDAGNTRIKWALTNDEKWEEIGIISADCSNELVRLIEKRKAVTQIWASNVAGDKVERDILALGISETNIIQPQQTCCGVKNGYENPMQLGSDRWLALIAAWALLGKKCLVVNSGTATTIDALSENGEFIGGLILPGLETMKKSLELSTFSLKTSHGNFQEFPRCTDDAVMSGTIQATCGAIDRQRTMLGNQDTPIIISGGAAHLLEAYIGTPILKVENLVLHGIEQVSKAKKTI